MLERYELLCMQCLQLRLRTSLGENVSKEEAQSLISDFITLNKGIKSQEFELSPAQRRRFSAISRWFTTGVINKLPEFEYLPELNDLMIPEALVKYECVDSLAYAKGIRRVRSRPAVFVLASLSAPDVSYGLMAGFQVRRSGVYARLSSNYQHCPTSYSCYSDGSLDGSGYFWASGAYKRTNLYASAGPVVGLSRNFSVSAGLGYGSKKIVWEDIEGAWAKVSDKSHSGILVECGALCLLKRLSFSVGIHTIAFRTVGATCGVGVKL